MQVLEEALHRLSPKRGAGIMVELETGLDTVVPIVVAGCSFAGADDLAARAGLE